MKNRIWVFGAIAVLSLGVLGAGLKYLEEDAKKQNALKVPDRSALLSESVRRFTAADTDSAA